MKEVDKVKVEEVGEALVGEVLTQVAVDTKEEMTTAVVISNSNNNSSLILSRTIPIIKLTCANSLSNVNNVLTNQDAPSLTVRKSCALNHQWVRVSLEDLEEVEITNTVLFLEETLIQAEIPEVEAQLVDLQVDTLSMITTLSDKILTTLALIALVVTRVCMLQPDRYLEAHRVFINHRVPSKMIY